MLKKLGGVLALAGLMITIFGFREGIAGMKKPVDLYADETNVSEVGFFDMATAEVFEVYGSYATKTTTENGKKTNEESYYIIPAHEGDEFRYIGIKVNEKDYKTFDKIVEETYDYYDGIEPEGDYTTIKVTGCLKKMNKEMQGYYYNTFKKAEWFDSDEEMKKEALPYYLDTLANPKSMVTFLFVGVIMFLAGGIMFVFGMRSENKAINKAAEQTYVIINGVSYAKAELAHVNQCIQGQEKVFAAQELARITGMSVEEATNVVENWRRYYY